MLPLFKETVETLFAQGLVKVVFATETLSLGINMPAKTVVIEDLWKFSGERHELLTPGEYTQLTGRAGRRGIDPIGYAVVLYQRQVPFERVAGLASTRTYELRSSFRPSYNMTVNLVRNYTRQEARHLLNSSFAQFLADRGVVTLERERERDGAAIDRVPGGDAVRPGRLRRVLAAARTGAADPGGRAADRGSATPSASVRDALAAAAPGRRRSGCRAPAGGGVAVVVSVREGRPTVMLQDRRFFRASAADFEHPPARLAHLDLPRSGSGAQRAVPARPGRRGWRRSSCRARIGVGRRAGTDPKAEARAEELDRRAREHPCHSCPDRKKHEHWAERASKLERDIAGLDRRIRSRTETLGKQFDRVVAVLEELGYVRRLHADREGRAAAADLRRGRPDRRRDHRRGAARRAVTVGGRRPGVSAVLYESRERIPRRAELPTPALRSRMRRDGDALAPDPGGRGSRTRSSCHGSSTRGSPATIFAWAEGKPLEDVLGEAGAHAGRLRADDEADPRPAPPDPRGGAAGGGRDGDRRGATRINRSVVAYTGV